ncbi:MAG: TolC family outer membrane protein [Rhizobiales bacterium]|nr:TolC family outer membrane protein [Hyphomicrobiales bacterium]
MKGWSGRIWGSFGALAAVVMALNAAAADTLPQALSQAYLGNPTLRAARAQQRATDENVPQALSGWRPTVTLQGNIGPTFTDQTSIPTASLFSTTKKTTETYTQNMDGQVKITLTQPIFRGFGTVEGTAQAEANVRAGQQNLLGTEQQVLFNAVQAYAYVIYYRELVSLQQENVGVLEAQLKASNERFKVGEITRTDVAQSKASLSQAKGTLAAYQSQMANWVATYVQIIGNQPGKLVSPPLVKTPPSLEEAYRIAEQTNPTILSQAFVEEAANHAVGVQRAPLLPQLSLQATASAYDNLSQRGGHTESASIYGVLTIPLYEQGYYYSKVRQAKQSASQARIQVIEKVRAVRQVVAATWNAVGASRQEISAANDQVAAAQLALDGVKEEYRAGTRTTLDVLNAQQAVVTARSTLIQFRRDQVLNAYLMLSSIGRLTARDLALQVPLYDPGENYRKVRDKWFGTGVDTVE